MPNGERTISDPMQLKRCSRCVMPETQEVISFDKDGVCATCRNVEAKREKIDWIRSVGPDGKERIFTLDGENLDKKPDGEVRAMDCIDCHNHAGHHQQEPEAAIDAAIASGRISRQLPGIRKIAVATLQKPWTRDRAREQIRRDLEQAYAANGGGPAAKGEQLRGAAEAIADIWLRNVHPDMKLGWGTYPDFSGHRGCMRCHDGQHLAHPSRVPGEEDHGGDADPDPVRAVGHVGQQHDQPTIKKVHQQCGNPLRSTNVPFKMPWKNPIGGSHNKLHDPPPNGQLKMKRQQISDDGMDTHCLHISRFFCRDLFCPMAFFAASNPML